MTKAKRTELNKAKTKRENVQQRFTIEKLDNTKQETMYFLIDVEDEYNNILSHTLNIMHLIDKQCFNVNEYIELTFSNLISDKKSLKQLSTINKMVDNCLDLQSEAKDYENINLETHKKKTNDLQKNILDKLNNLDIYETKLLKNSNNINYLLMLCSRNSEMDEDTIETLRNKIFNSRINKIGNAYIQELKGEAFIEIK